MPDNLGTPSIAVSWGEVFDRISILELKVAHMNPGNARIGQRAELTELQGLVAKISNAEIAQNFDRLRQINQQLWSVEDDLRYHEKMQEFGDTFVALARSVYVLNDQRAALKRAINSQLGSNRTEQKVYKSAQTPGQ